MALEICWIALVVRYCNASERYLFCIIKFIIYGICALAFDILCTIEISLIITHKWHESVTLSELCTRIFARMKHKQRGSGFIMSRHPDVRVPKRDEEITGTDNEIMTASLGTWHRVLITKSHQLSYACVCTLPWHSLVPCKTLKITLHIKARDNCFMSSRGNCTVH